MKVGFTGTREGMTQKQKDVFEYLMRVLAQSNYVSFHHGGCIGADEEAHDILTGIQRENLNVMVGNVIIPTKIMIVVHPGDQEKYQADCPTDARLTPKPCLERDKDIVYSSQILVACPKTKEEERRSGTWATIRYARKACVPIIILEP